MVEEHGRLSVARGGEEVRRLWFKALLFAFCEKCEMRI